MVVFTMRIFHETIYIGLNGNGLGLRSITLPVCAEKEDKNANQNLGQALIEKITEDRLTILNTLMVLTI